MAKTHTTVAFSAYNATVMIDKVSRATFLSDFIAEEGQEALFGDISGRKRSPGGMLTYSNLSHFGKVRQNDYFWFLLKSPLEKVVFEKTGASQILL